MVIPETFKRTGNRPTINYDFIEFASGFGIATLYLGNTVDKKTISSSTFYSNSVWTQSSNMTTTADALRLDHDYDIEIQKPMTIEGVAIVNAGIGVYRSGATNTGYFVFKLRKYSGSTETEIANNTSSIHTNSGTVGYTYAYTCTDITVPRTHFAIGDILRLTVEVWGAGGANPSYVAYAHDPANRTTGWDGTGVVPSKLILNLPIRVEI